MATFITMSIATLSVSHVVIYVMCPARQNRHSFFFLRILGMQL